MQKIFIEFKSFDLEDPSDNLCTYDNVTIYDGEETSDSEIGSYCGDTLPPDFQTTSQTLIVHFRSDSSVTFNGFKFNWITVMPSEY